MEAGGLLKFSGLSYDIYIYIHLRRPFFQGAVRILPKTTGIF